MHWIAAVVNVRSACRLLPSRVQAYIGQPPWAFVHQQRRRPKLAGSSASAKSRRADSAASAKLDALAESNRSRWLQSIERQCRLTGLLPQSSVYMTGDFEPCLLSLVDSVQLLREAGQPDMYDCLVNPLIAKITLNMATKKKTKFIQEFQAHVVLPHALDFLPKRRLLALCKSEEEANSLIEQGALDAGMSELFGRIEHGAFHWESYDTVVADSSWASSLSKLRNVLKDRMPTFKNGRLGDDLSSIFATYSTGVSLKSTSLDGVPEIALLEATLGQLSWDVELLEANLLHYLQVIEQNKSNRIEGNFVRSIDLFCPPTGEQFGLDLTQLSGDLPTQEEETITTTVHSLSGQSPSTVEA